MVLGHLWDDLGDREREILVLLSQGAADKEIAAKLHLSLNTVKWHNRQIYAKLGVTNRTQAVVLTEKLGLLSESGAQKKPASRIPNNLPAPVSSFVGREDEIAEIMDLLQDHRLVTLTGPGGVGKTRLALEVASSIFMEGRYPDGIYFVELAPVSDPARVGEAILEAVGIKLEVGQKARDRLIALLDEKTLLIILDNFEHLLEGAPLVVELLHESPDLQVLTTTREILHLSGEQSFIVPPLEIDPSRELFIQRAREVQPSFDPASDETTVIDHICSRLDGLPLAIELAAARLPLFSLNTLFESMEDRFQVLTAGPLDAPARQQTLWDAIDWSYQLLTPEEQVLFRRLAVFQGSRTIDAVQEICCFDLKLSALDGLASLLAKNLVRQEEGLDGEARFYLLETLHKFAWELLTVSGEEQSIRRRHAIFFVNLADRSRIHRLRGEDVIFWLEKITSDFENLRLAHDWSLAQEEDTLRLRLNYGLLGIWGILGHLQEGTDWIEKALMSIDSAPLSLQAGVYWAAASISSFHNQYDRSLEFGQEALTRFQKVGDKQSIGQCHLDMIINLARGGNKDEGCILDHYQAAVEIFSSLGNQCGLADAYWALACHYDYTARESLSCQLMYRALKVYREIGAESKAWGCLVNLADYELKKGNARIAKDMCLEVLQGEYAQFGNLTNIEGTLECLAPPELALGCPRRAVILLAAGNAIRKRKGVVAMSPGHQNIINKTLDQSAAQLSQAVFDEAWERGQSLSFEEAIAFALQEGES